MQQKEDNTVAVGIIIGTMVVIALVAILAIKLVQDKKAEKIVPAIKTTQQKKVAPAPDIESMLQEEKTVVEEVQDIEKEIEALEIDSIEKDLEAIEKELNQI